MKAICMRGVGSRDVLHLADVPAPVLRNDSDALVRIVAFSVNAADWKVRRGLTGAPVEFPHILGRDFSGIVTEAGPACDLRKGDAVVGVCANGQEGAYAEQIVIDHRLLAGKPADIGHSVAAAFGLAALTALVCIEDVLRVVSGERVFIRGGAGGVATMAIQLAKLAGSEVVAAARPVNHPYLRNLGADVTVDYTQDGYANGLPICDAALDTVGGAGVADTFAVLRRGGRAAFIASGASAPDPPRSDLEAIRPHVRRSRDLLERVMGRVRKGELKQPAMTVLPAEKIAQAHELSESGNLRGKIVLEW